MELPVGGMNTAANLGAIHKYMDYARCATMASLAQSKLVYVVSHVQFERGFISPYFVTDPERMVAEYANCKLLLVDKKIANAREIIKILENTIKGKMGIPTCCLQQLAAWVLSRGWPGG